MRTIEFRTWDGTEMDYDPMPPYDWDINTTFTDETKKWMQFTGLKDNKSRKIWEGDIVVYGIGSVSGDVRFGKYKTRDENTDIQIHIGFYIHNEVWGDSPLDPENIHGISGNIYENPDLLKI